MSSGTKVFVGNLAYSTTEQDLQRAFSKCGKILDAKVVRRGNRSKGYGFVEFEDEEDAQKSVDAFDKVELNGRSINVQLSTSTGEDKRSSYDDRPRYNNNYGGGSNFGRYRNNYGGGRYNNRGRGNYYNRSPGARRPVYSLRKNFGNDRDSYENKRRYRDEVEKVDSETIVFVANLPYSYYDEDLVDLFKKCGDIKTAHVVRTRGRSKGYGFVEFQTHEGQLEALEKMDNFPVENDRGEERELSVKVAKSEKESEQESRSGDDDDDEESRSSDK
jgi:RNA recognition motif-containing protein